MLWNFTGLLDCVTLQRFEFEELSRIISSFIQLLRLPLYTKSMEKRCSWIISWWQFFSDELCKFIALESHYRSFSYKWQSNFQGYTWWEIKIALYHMKKNIVLLYMFMYVCMYISPAVFIRKASKFKACCRICAIFLHCSMVCKNNNTSIIIAPNVQNYWCIIASSSPWCPINVPDQMNIKM